MDEHQYLKGIAVDVSHEFESMDLLSFKDFLKTKDNEAVLQIQARLSGGFHRDHELISRLNNFLANKPEGQKRFATIQATEADYKKHPDEFTAGIKWEKI